LLYPTLMISVRRDPPKQQSKSYPMEAVTRRDDGRTRP